VTLQYFGYGILAVEAQRGLHLLGYSAQVYDDGVDGPVLRSSAPEDVVRGLVRRLRERGQVPA
jgi:nitrous oxidase accessory protein NosD